MRPPSPKQKMNEVGFFLEDLYTMKVSVWGQNSAILCILMHFRLETLPKSNFKVPLTGRNVMCRIKLHNNGADVQGRHNTKIIFLQATTSTQLLIKATIKQTISTIHRLYEYIFDGGCDCFHHVLVFLTARSLNSKECAFSMCTPTSH